MATHFVGDKVKLRNTVKDEDGDVADPTALRVIVEPLLAAATTYSWPADAEVVKVSTGVFYFEFTTTESGPHQVSWDATGAIVKAGQTSFNVAAKNTTR